MKFLMEVLTEVKSKKGKRALLRAESEMSIRLRRFVAGLNKAYEGLRDAFL